MPRALGLEKWILGSVCSKSNIENEIAVGQWPGPRRIKEKLAILMILKLNYKEQKWNQEGICVSENRNPSECISSKRPSRDDPHK